MVAATVPSRVPTERRRALRRQPTVGTVCKINSAMGEPINGLVWNMSTTGLSVLVHRALEAGASVHIEISTGDGANRLECEFRIAHVSRMRSGDFIVGGQFGRCLEPAEMQPFLTAAAG